MPHVSGRLIRLVNRWAPRVLLAVFSVGISSILIMGKVHGQDQADATAAANAVNIAVLQRQVTDLGDLPAQGDAMRERMVRVESKTDEHTKQLEDIAYLEKWLVLGVFGMIGSMALKTYRNRAANASDDERVLARKIASIISREREL